MAEKGFEPLTSQLGISGTSYRLQLGFINEKWASRILKGKDVIDSYVYKDEDIAENDAPNQNLIVGWVLRTVTLPNINPYGIMKTTQALVKQALTNKEKRKVVAPLEETKKIELEKVPESEIRRPKAAGWVTDGDKRSPAQIEAEKRAAFQERMKAKAEEVAASSAVASSAAASPEPAPIKTATASSPVATVKTTRKLPSIPTGTSAEAPKAEIRETPSTEATPVDASKFCPFCGKDLEFKFCPYCGKPLPHSH